MADPDNQIKVSVVKAPFVSTDETEQAPPLSIYIYIAGLFVSLSGMYAATYDMADMHFVLTLRALVVCGYGVSYWLRKNRIDLKQYQAPLLVVFATVMYFVASTAPELSAATTANGLARPYQIQIVVIWIAVLQSFTLCTDSAILFACVPSMALLGIMSSGTPDTEVQYAFYVFVASATFMMVHENHLRTRTAMALRNRSAVRLDNRLFRGEIMLVGCCVFGTMLLATIVSTPIEIVGRALIPSNSQEGSKGSQSKQATASANVHVDEEDSIDLGTGPSTEGDVDLLSVTSTPPIPYLRGTTHDYYTGHRFDNHLTEDQTLEPVEPGVSDEYTQESRSTMQHKFNLDPATMDTGTGRMDGAVEVKQSVKVLGGTITHLYGAPVFVRVSTDYPNLKVSKAGSVSTSTPMVQGKSYQIDSLAPTTNHDAMRLSGTDYPRSVVSSYLQVTNPLQTRNQRLQRFAAECISGKNNPYDRVIALQAAVASRCTYNLQAPAIPGDRDVVEAFLFDFKQGDCRRFAAALTVLCRYANIPARFATGFIQGDLQGDGSYTVREKHKHAWTEVYFTNIGWVSFEATEGAHDVTPSGNVTAKAAATPLTWLASHGAGPPAILLLILILVGYVVRTELLSRYGKKTTVAAGYELLPASNMEIVRLYQNACTVLARSGLSRPLHLTPTEYRFGVSERLSTSADAGAMLDVLTNLHQTFTYSRAMASDADVAAARSALDRLTSAIASLPTSISTSIPAEQPNTN